ncbi:hypothetical protein CEXT_81751 [Caerostris extrusa]|uniref:Integrase zinc-binding domain-containing protein n=1 Tax=Caerostris extrusa TaxID=172846 RepID=A0AAV4QT85_CAEEX|nr:hypothetical protein CEXT_81751 [Caerostris extrusa]
MKMDFKQEKFKLHVPDSVGVVADFVMWSSTYSENMIDGQNCDRLNQYGEDGTYHHIAQRYYWTDMRSYIANYGKKFPECCQFKGTKQKFSGLLRTPPYAE